jgi:hypothetical protein
MKRLEGKLTEVRNWNELAAAHTELIDAFKDARESQLRLGYALLKYKAYYKADQTWIAFLNEAAIVQGCSAMTLRRLMENCERASGLPQMVVDAMLSAHIDPAETKNKPIVESLVIMPAPRSPNDAREAVSLVHTARLAEKRAAGVHRTPFALPTVVDVVRQIIRILRGLCSSKVGAAEVDEIRYVIETVITTFGIDVSSLRQYSRADLVPKPKARGAA